MKLNLVRHTNSADFCVGRLYVASSSLSADPADCSLGDYFLCDTLEPPVRSCGPVVKGRSAIPAGIYPLYLTRSPRFGRVLPLLGSVPGFSGIRIHRGNSVDDTRGCILPGRYVGGGRLSDSAVAEAHVMSALQGSGGDDFIEVVNAFDSSALPVASDVVLRHHFGLYPVRDVLSPRSLLALSAASAA